MEANLVRRTVNNLASQIVLPVGILFYPISNTEIRNKAWKKSTLNKS